MEAAFVKDLDGWQGDAKLYKLSEPITLVQWFDDEPFTFNHIVVSAVVAYSGPETYVFAADENGEVENWQEMDGSFHGALDHSEALDGFLSSR
jgi:hypothetical protein